MSGGSDGKVAPVGDLSNLLAGMPPSPPMLFEIFIRWLLHYAGIVPL